MRPRHSAEDVHAICKIDPWFLAQIQDILTMEARIRAHGIPTDAENLRLVKSMGFSDARLGSLTGKRGTEVAKARHALGVRPVYKRIDTCAAEFASPTAYMYSTYEVPFAGAPPARRGSRPREVGSSAAAQPHRPAIESIILLRRGPCAQRTGYKQSWSLSPVNGRRLQHSEPL